MSTKSRKRKRRISQPTQKNNKSLAKPFSKAKTAKLATVLAVLGVLLTAAGLIALRPQLNVSMDEPLDAMQPYSPTFRIANAGLMAVSDVHAYCYADKFEVAGASISDAVVGGQPWVTATLERGEPMTIVCNMLKTNIPVTSFDIAIGVEYSPYRVPWLRSTQLFRWVGSHTPSGGLRLLPQPSSPVRDRALAAILRFKQRPH